MYDGMQDDPTDFYALLQKAREEQILLHEKQKTEHDREILLLKQDNYAIIKEKNELQLDFDRLQQETQMFKDKNNELTTDHLNLKKILDEKSMNESMLKLKCEQLEKAEINTYHKLEENAKKIIEYEKEIAILSTQLTTLQKSTNESQQIIQILRDEKLFLSQEKSHLEGQLKYFQKQIA